MGDSHFARCLQGGGVLVQGGSVTFDSCTITGNTATYVHAHPQNFPSPRWDFYMFCACACRAVVSLSLEAQWPSHRAPSLAIQLLMCVLTLKSPHRPDGKIADMLALTPARTTAADASVNNRMYVPQRPSKVPIAPMGRLLTYSPRLTSDARPTPPPRGPMSASMEASSALGQLPSPASMAQSQVA